MNRSIEEQNAIYYSWTECPHSNGTTTCDCASCGKNITFTKKLSSFNYQEVTEWKAGMCTFCQGKGRVDNNPLYRTYKPY